MRVLWGKQKPTMAPGRIATALVCAIMSCMKAWRVQEVPRLNARIQKLARGGCLPRAAPDKHAVCVLLPGGIGMRWK